MTEVGASRILMEGAAGSAEALDGLVKEEIEASKRLKEWLDGPVR